MKKSLLGPLSKPLRRANDWVLSWAQTPYGTPALFVLAFAESSFFPIPPDILLIALAVAIPKKSFKYAGICSLGSVLGGVFGWVIGKYFFESIGGDIIQSLGLMEKFEVVKAYYNESAFLYIFISAFTPIPYKVFTIAAGACHIPLATLIAASVIGRSARFFLVAALIHHFGSSIKTFMDKYFDLLCIIMTLLLIGGFLLLKIL